MTLVLPAGDMLKKIQSDLNLQEGREQEDLSKLKEWLACQPHLPQIEDDRLLAGFLYGCKNSMERCKKVLDMHYTVRGAAPEFFKNRDPKSADMRSCLDSVYIVPMPKLTAEGARVTIHSLQDPSKGQFNASECMKLVFLTGDIRLREDICSGDILVYDLNGSSLSHLAQLTLPLVRKFMICGQSAYPVRLREVHLVNAPSFLDKILALFKPLMKDKLADRIHVHSNVTALQKFLSKDVLPKEYEGEAGDLKELHASWREKLESYRDWFIGQESVLADEAKRPGGKPVTQDDLFGLDGSFRQLSVD
ncbi:alpha-tocopherol transfer protein-like [Neocloeon triangulifer]|uniref:alpha-tocopherol transfer protein-like n=1 Tax=Neocloeon triangulifer TaxID=2078957 RepID=UPI00286EF366|nr:alpha-tocopherol transfer protein-like [Neocloeon triangulifer]